MSLQLKVAAEVTERRAAALVKGDRVAGAVLPTAREFGDVEFVGDFQMREPWVMVVFRLDDGRLESQCFLADAVIPLEHAADSAGFAYSREADEDPRPVSPARVPLHTAALEGAAGSSTVHPSEGDELVIDGGAS